MLYKFSNRTKILSLIILQRRTSLLTLLMCFVLSNFAYAAGRAYYYRYYDQRGTAVVSHSVSAAHIQTGYDVLDQQMILIRKVPAYNLDKDLKQQHDRAKRARQLIEQRKLTRAYRDAKYTQGKKQRRLSKLYQQLAEQYRGLQVLQQENAKLLHLRASYYRRGVNQPQELLQQFTLNQVSIQEAHHRIDSVQHQLQQQSQFYDEIITRLQ